MIALGTSAAMITLSANNNGAVRVVPVPDIDSRKASGMDVGDTMI
jgi:hypothetical protein